MNSLDLKMKPRKMWLEQNPKSDYNDLTEESPLEYSIWEIPENKIKTDGSLTYHITGTKYIEPVYILTERELSALLAFSEMEKDILEHKKGRIMNKESSMCRNARKKRLDI